MKEELLSLIKRKPLVSGIIIILLSVGFGVSVSAYMKKTETPLYCASCHVMLPQYEDWFYTGQHKQVKCIECHLPNDNVFNHYLWKGLDGMKDVLFFYTGLVPEPIHSSAHAKKTIQANCIRCHDQTVSQIADDTMRCWECHRKLWHNRINEF